MEFYRQLERSSDEAQLQALLSLDRLPQLCDSIDSPLEQQGNQGQICCLWGVSGSIGNPFETASALPCPAA
jgi:hypothetical protein